MNDYKPEGSLLRTVENHAWFTDLNLLEQAMERGVILESTALLCDAHFTLHFDFGCIKARMPREEVVYMPNQENPKDIAILTRVGKAVCFKIIGFSRDEYGERFAVLSRKRAQLECTEQYVKTLLPGDIILSRVTHLEHFGAFMDIGCGIVSLLSIDCLSVSRITHPKERLAVGETVHTVIKSIDHDGRIYVSRRELLGTWEENASLFAQGQTVTGIVRSVESYGIFVELTPNLAGLAEPKENVEVGDCTAVFIKSILPDKMKIKLVIIDAHANEYNPRTCISAIDPNEVSHIEHWRYSPPYASKIIESNFDTDYAILT